MISGHGDDRYQYDKPIGANFSSNVWFEGTPPELIRHLQQNLSLIDNYPEPDAADLCRRIAVSYDVNPDQVLAYNGSVEAFYAIALTFREAVSAILAPAFAEYEDACRMHQHRIQFFKSEECESVLESQANLFWIGNPNNPDGQIFNFQKIEQWLGKYPNTLFVVDEAYAEVVFGFQSVIRLTRNFVNLIVICSMTKCCAIPGLRLGYIIASEKLASQLRKFQQPWSVNALAQEAGKFLIDHLSKYPLQTQIIQQRSLNFQRLISQLDGFHAIPSKAPFFLVEMQSGNAVELKRFLLNKHEILIRDAANFRGLSPNYFRVCTLSESDNRLLINGLFDWNKNRLI